MPQLANAGLLRPQAKSPDTFDGSTPPVNDWLFQMTLYFRATGIAQQNQLAFAASLLRGKALTWWRYHSRTGLEPERFEDFAGLVQRQFQSIDSVKLARDRLANIRQKTSVERFTAEFQEIILAIPGIHEGEALDRYIRALKPRIRTEVSLRDPRSLQDAMAMAARFDAILFDEYRRQPSHNRELKPSLRSYRAPQTTRETAFPARSGVGTPMDLDVDTISSRTGRGRLSEEQRRELILENLWF